jgi:hypothetical protein
MERRALLTGAAVVAFDRAARTWLTHTGPAAGSRRAADPVPELDGTLTTDPGALAGAGDDFGHIVHERPVAVLRPGSVRDAVAVPATPPIASSRAPAAGVSAWPCGKVGSSRTPRTPGRGVTGKMLGVASSGGWPDSMGGGVLIYRPGERL